MSFTGFYWALLTRFTVLYVNWFWLASFGRIEMSANILMTVESYIGICEYFLFKNQHEVRSLSESKPIRF